MPLSKRELRKKKRARRKILLRAHRVSLRKEDDTEYGRATGDTQILHENDEAARDAELGLLRSPVHGAHTADIAFNAEYALYRLDYGKEDEGMMISQRTACGVAVYHPRILNQGTPRWLFGGITECNKIITVKVSAYRKGETVIESRLRIKPRKDYKKLEKIIVGPINASIRIFPANQQTHARLMSPQEVRTEEIHPSLIQSYTPGILVRILERAYEDIPLLERPLPANGVMETTWYAQAHCGTIDTQTFMTREKSVEEKWMYEFHTVLVQDGKIIAATDVLSASKHSIDKERLKSVDKLPEFFYHQ